MVGVKPPRPSVRFPTYKAEASATVVDERRWFEEPDVAKPPPSEGSVTKVNRPTPTPRAESKREAQPTPSKREARAPEARKPDLGRCQLDARELVPAAPSWALPAVPTVAVRPPERHELPSFGPVAFDVERASIPTVPRMRVPTPPAGPRPAFVGVSAMVATLGLLAGFHLARESSSVAPVTAVPALAAAPVAPPVAPTEAAPPALVAAAIPPADPAPATDVRTLAPEDLFPPAPAPAAAAPPSRAEYRINHARHGADIARRNAPEVPMGARTGWRPNLVGAPTVDDVLRTRRLRGEAD